MSLPRGPRTALIPILSYLRDPYGTTLRAHRRYGATYTVRTMAGKVVLTGEAEAVRAILSADPDTFDPFGVDLLAPLVGERSLLVLAGARHRAARKLLAPPFHGARMRAYAETMRAVALAQAASWPHEQPFVMQSTMQAISMQVIIQSVFGVSDPATQEAFRQALVELLARFKPSFIFVRWLRRALWPAWRHFVIAKQTILQLVSAEIRRRRADGTRGDDILSLLLDARYDDGSALDEDEIMEQLTTLLVAGHETTAIALTWAAYLIARHPAVEERLRAELAGAGADASAEQLAQLPYLEAVCNETLRLQPLTTQFARRMRRPFQLAGYPLPAGVGVSVSVIALHRDPTIYPEPEAFVPERFLERSYAAHEFVPFGGGTRRCIGAAFAMYEMKIVLATLLRRYRLRSAETAAVPTIARNTVVGPRGGIRMCATRVASIGDGASGA